MLSDIILFVIMLSAITLIYIIRNVIMLSVILQNAMAPCWMAAKRLHFSMSRKFSGIVLVPPKVDQFGQIFQKLAILQLAGWNSNLRSS